MVPDAGLTSTDATGTAVTVTAELPLFPSLVAVMETGPPAALPVTRPFASTVARLASLVTHVMVRPVSALPAASFGVAVSCSVVPTTTLAGEGVTSTEATGAGVTVTLDVPLFPSLVECDRRSEEHTSELQSRLHLVCRLLLEKKKHNTVEQNASFQHANPMYIAAPSLLVAAFLLRGAYEARSTQRFVEDLNGGRCVHKVLYCT